MTFGFTFEGVWGLISDIYIPTEQPSASSAPSSVLQPTEELPCAFLSSQTHGSGLCWSCCLPSLAMTYVKYAGQGPCKSNYYERDINSKSNNYCIYCVFNGYQCFCQVMFANCLMWTSYFMKQALLWFPLFERGRHPRVVQLKSDRVSRKAWASCCEPLTFPVSPTILETRVKKRCYIIPLYHLGQRTKRPGAETELNAIFWWLERREE